MLAWLSEQHGATDRPVLLEEGANGTVTVRVGRKILVVSPTACGWAAAEVGQAGRGRPQQVRREAVQRQFVQCFRQLVHLREQVAMRMATEKGLEADPYVLKKALNSVRRRVRRGERFWLRTLRLALVTAKQIDPARSSKDRRAIEFEKSDGTLVRLRVVPVTSAGYLLFEVAPVERWSAFMAGRFSPHDLALRILSVFYQLEFSFLWNEDFDDHNLYIRKTVYPLTPAVRAALAEAPREARELREATEARWARKQRRSRSSINVP